MLKIMAKAKMDVTKQTVTKAQNKIHRIINENK